MVKWIGHRGFSGPFAQNTIPAFIEGAKQGCYALECDVRVSIDDVFYICHDDVFLEYLFKDVTLVGKLMAPYSWSQLRTFELQGKYHGVTYSGCQLASLEEYLTICKEYHIGAIIELKWTRGLNPNDTSKVKELLALVEKYELFEQTIFMSSMRDVLLIIQKENPKATIQLLTGVQTTTPEVAKWCCEHGFSMDALAKSITPEIVEIMHQHELLINSYTVNDPKLADDLINLGIDMITSDVLSPFTYKKV